MHTPPILHLLQIKRPGPSLFFKARLSESEIRAKLWLKTGAIDYGPDKTKKLGCNGKISGVKSSRIKSTLELLGCDQYPHSLFKNKHYSTLTDEPF